MAEKSTTIRVTLKTKCRLEALAAYQDTMDDLIKRLITELAEKRRMGARCLRCGTVREPHYKKDLCHALGWCKYEPVIVSRPKEAEP